MQISAPVRIVGLVGLLLALAVGGWTFVAGSRSTGATSSPSEHRLGPVAKHPIAAAESVAAKLNAHNRATAAGKADVSPAEKPARTIVHPASPEPTVTAGGAPLTIAGALRRHRVAVVLVYDPQTKVDGFSVGEAQLGAKRAHAAFLRVNVLKQSQALPFAKAYGVLQVPTVLFFARPGKVVQKLVGYEDQDTIAQAAVNAARGLVAGAG
jgi:hypothetical protein